MSSPEASANSRKGLAVTKWTASNYLISEACIMNTYFYAGWAIGVYSVCLETAVSMFEAVNSSSFSQLQGL